MLTGGAGISRAVGMALFGVATGISMGLVEGALKDRWIYVAAGPLAGKQFILYKPLTIIGSDQSCDIYLFKDPSVQPQHASIELRGQRALVRAAGLVLVQGKASERSSARNRAIPSRLGAMPSFTGTGSVVLPNEARVPLLQHRH